MRLAIALVALFAVAIFALGPEHIHDGFCGVHHWTHLIETEGMNKSQIEAFRSARNTRAPNAACVEHPVCDYVNELAAAGFTTTPPQESLRIRLKWIVATLDGQPVVSIDTLKGQLATLNDDFAGTGIQWDNDNDPSDDLVLVPVTACTAAYSGSQTWYNDITAFKRAAGVLGKNQLNVYVHCMRTGSQGTLLGIATFPWTVSSGVPVWQSDLGGLFLNSVAVGQSQRTFSHEIGHNFGLWHLFHGEDETSGCNDVCTETMAEYGTARGREVGDLCSDTIIAPLNYNCANPTGSDCDGKSFSTLPNGAQPSYLNIMSYSADTCMTNFSPQQGQRMRCYLCKELSAQTYNSATACP